MVYIEQLHARQILNSRGEPTVEVEVLLNNEVSARASAPSGKSRSSYEAVELLDKNFSRYFGKSVNHAVKNVNHIISPRLKKQIPTEQQKIDQILVELDGTPNMAHLGGNATIATSIAVSKAAAKIEGKPPWKYLNYLFEHTDAKNRYQDPIELSTNKLKTQLPLPAFNLINGGAHADNQLAIQEYLIVPVGFENFAQRLRAATEVTHELKTRLRKENKVTTVGDEGGFAPQFKDLYEPLEYLKEAVNKAGYARENKILYAFDVAGTDIPDDFYQTVFSQYPVIGVEDPYPEDSWEQFAKLNEKYANIFVVGDDLTATNPERLYKAIKRNSVNCVIVKPNQIGTLTQTLEFAKIAKEANLELFVANRSGETNDSFIADLAVGLGAKFIKAGAPVRGERVAKYNRLAEIAPHVGEQNQ